MILKLFVDDDGWLHCCWRGGEETQFWKARPQDAFVVRHLYRKRDSSGNHDLSVKEGLGVVESATSPVIGYQHISVIDRNVGCGM